MKSEKNPCVGSQRIDNLGSGQGETLRFVNIPSSLSKAMENDIAGINKTSSHPLSGTEFHTEHHKDKTFSITIFQNDVEDLPKAFADWFMSHLYMEYADVDTYKKLHVFVTETI